MPATVHELPAWECFELLVAHGIGRLCLIDAGSPIAVPVNYRLGSHQQIIVRTAPNSMVGRYRGPCSLEVDDIDISHERAWSVIAPRHRSCRSTTPRPACPIRRRSSPATCSTAG